MTNFINVKVYMDAAAVYEDDLFHFNDRTTEQIIQSNQIIQNSTG